MKLKNLFSFFVSVTIGCSWLKATSLVSNQPEKDLLPIKNAQAFCRLAIKNRKKGKYPMALTCYKKALLIYQGHLGCENIACADILNSIGLIYYKQRNYDKATLYREESLKIYRKKFGKKEPNKEVDDHKIPSNILYQAFLKAFGVFF